MGAVALVLVIFLDRGLSPTAAQAALAVEAVVLHITPHQVVMEA